MINTLRWSLLTVLLAIAAVAVLLIATSPAAPDATATSTDERAADFLRRQLVAANTPDAAFAVVRDGRVTVSGAVGDGVTADTPFMVGSLSKSFTALAIMQLVDRGAIGLDDPVTKHIPWFRTADADAVITVRQLLDQTSGLPTSAGTADLNTPEVSLVDRVHALADVRLEGRPGERFQYCNKNYATLGLVVELASGQSYSDYLREHVFGPLRMTNSFTDLAQARQAGLVDGSNVWFGVNLSRSTTPYPGALADGYLISTANDLSHYAQAQLEGTYEGERIISAESLDQMHRSAVSLGADSPLSGSDGYGFGWGIGTVDGQRLVSHPGDLGTFHSDLALLPDQGVGLVVLTARNGVLFNTAEAYDGALSILAGLPTPEASRSFVFTYLAVDLLAVLLLFGMATSVVRLLRRSRNLPERRVFLPALAGIVGAVAVYLLVFYGLGAAMGSDGPLQLATAYGYAPDVTVLILAIVAFLALRGLLPLALSLKTRPTPDPAG